MTPTDRIAVVERTVDALGSIGAVLNVALLAVAVALVAAAVLPGLRRYLRVLLAAAVGLLAVGEAALVWFHWRLWVVAIVVDPSSGTLTGRIAVPLWVESEKLYFWALILGIMALSARRHGDELRPLLATGVAALMSAAILWGKPFTDPLPDFLGQYHAYLVALEAGPSAAAIGAYQSLESARVYFYNTWYMWVHPPLLFLCYGAFAVSFAATILMIRERRSAYETTVFRWIRLGYQPLTLGMLLGFPWAILAWSGSAWWWSGKINMSIMMWLLYTAYLHGRLYLRRRGMWKVVAVLSVLSFIALALTYVTTYVVPGAHSVVGS